MDFKDYMKWMDADMKYKGIFTLILLAFLWIWILISNAYSLGAGKATEYAYNKMKSCEMTLNKDDANKAIDITKTIATGYSIYIIGKIIQRLPFPINLLSSAFIFIGNAIYTKKEIG